MARHVIQSFSKSAGRPRDLEKREAILESAWRCFLADGIRGTSLERIARQAGVTRVTLYSHFADKTVLFEAVIRREMERLVLSQRPLQVGIPLRDGLIGFGVGLMTYLTSADAVSFYSVLAGDLRHYPHLARAFFDLGPAVTRKNLAIILATAAAQGELSIQNAEEAVTHLIGLWQGLSNFELALGIYPQISPELLTLRVERAVDVFLTAYARLIVKEAIPK